MPKKKLIMGMATVTVILIMTGLVYRMQSVQNIISSGEPEQRSQEFVQAAILVEDQTSDTQEGFTNTHGSFSQAFSTLSNGDRGTQIVEIQPTGGGRSDYVSSVEDLRDIWSPKFNQVSQDYGKLIGRIEYAKEKANSYFESQSALTSEISNPDTRRRWEQRDSEERAAFREWEMRIEEIKSRSSTMMDSFRDMDIIIQKQIGSAYFAELSEDFIFEMPQSLIRLDEDIAEFKARSEDIYSLFGSRVSEQFQQR